jgi:hypothetical protein
MVFAGKLGAQLLQAVILGLCLRAFGHHATMAELILVNSIADLLAGFMPVPGGMGVAEAAYTAGLVALGVPNAAAMSTPIAFRMVTYYLPPIWVRSPCAGCDSTRICRWSSRRFLQSRWSGRRGVIHSSPQPPVQRTGCCSAAVL